VARFGEGDQRVRGAALQDDARPKLGDPARRIEELACPEITPQQQQRLIREIRHVDRRTTLAFWPRRPTAKPSSS